MKKSLSLIFLFCSLFTVNGQDLSELFKRVDPSVVVIRIVERVSAGTGDRKQNTSMQALGSGVLIDESGLVITAAHVVNNADKIWVDFVDGQHIEAKVKYLSIQADVALIYTLSKPDNPVVSELGDSDEMKIGNQVIVVGAPLGLEHSFSSGYISGRHHQNRVTNDMSMAEFFQTDAAINHGNSGGPMFNMDGEVIGIASFILSESGGFEGLGFAATSNIVKQVLLDENNMYFGFQPMILPAKLARILNVPQDGGLLILSVAKNSPAYFMGLKGGFLEVAIEGQEFMLGGDVILALDGMKFESQESLEKIGDHLDSLKPGQEFVLTILREGEIQEIKWTKE